MDRLSLGNFTRSAIRRLARLIKLTFLVGIIPVLITLENRSMAIGEYLEVQSGSRAIPSLRVGSNDGHLIFETIPSTGTNWSTSVSRDTDHDCRNLITFLDWNFVAGFEINVGYFGLEVLSAVGLFLLWWTRRRKVSARGFEVLDTAQEAL
jgi:hypothetical protein